MTKNIERTVLITGANSGLGFEAAAQLAEQGWSRVILACRSVDKAAAARAELVERCGRDPFEELEVDVSDHGSVERAVVTLTERARPIDYLLLNAGLVSGIEMKRSKHGVELTMAASLVGHHLLTVGLLNADMLAADARIVIAGSEAARGDVPMFGVTDIVAFADEHFEGDRAEAIIAIGRGDAPYQFANMTHYANVKLLVAHWAAALARRLPEGMMVNAVSPGAAMATSAMRNQSAAFRVLSSVMSVIAPMFGMAGSVSDAAGRYVAAYAYPPERNGSFYASRPGKTIGPVVEQDHDHIVDRQSQEAAWRAVVELAGGAVLQERTRRVA